MIHTVNLNCRVTRKVLNNEKDTRLFQEPFLRVGTWHKYRKEMMHGGEEMTTGSIVVQMTIVNKYKTQCDIESSIELPKRIEN